MSPRAKIDRPITPLEVAVIRATLECSAVSPEAVPLSAGLEELRVVGRCPCGCDSVDFAEHEPADPAKPIADGKGVTSRGGTVGLIVWGRTGEVTALEVYDLGAGDEDLRLPVPDSITAFHESA